MKNKLLNKKKMEKELRNMPKEKLEKRDSNCKWPELEEEVSAWVEGQRALGCSVTRAMIQQKALDWAKAHQDQSINFQASMRWCCHFLERRNLKNLGKAKISSELSNNLENNDNGNLSLPKKRKRRKYDAAFKLEVLEYACQSSNHSAAKHFLISEKQVRDWKKAEDELRQMPKQKCANRGRDCKWPELEDDVCIWVEQQRALGCYVSRAMIRQRSLSWAEENPNRSVNFQASDSWCTRFIKRKKLMLHERQSKDMFQKVPRGFKDKLSSFHSLIFTNRKTNNYELSQIGTMDEICMNFGEIKNKSGKDDVMVVTTHEKYQFTVVLTCMADGTKLIPIVIFRNENIPKEKFPDGILVHANKTRWMDDAGCMQWVNKVWLEYCKCKRDKRSLLVWDTFKCHLDYDVNQKLKHANTDVALIPAGLTSVLQPVEVFLSKPFKDAMQQRWNSWMTTGESTSDGKFHLSISDLCQWIIDSWNSIKPEMIINSFKQCKISTSLDGTEDDLVWENDEYGEGDNNEMNESGGDCDPYSDILTEEVWHTLFDESPEDGNIKIKTEPEEM